MALNHDVVILAIDPGKKSGTALLHKGEPVMYGIANNARDRMNAVQMAVALHLDSGHPLVVVMEKWAAIIAPPKKNPITGKMERRPISPATYIGMGDGRGRWREHLELAGLPESRLVYVHSRTWQGPILGKQSKSSVMKNRARLYAEARWGMKLESDDEADALCIGAWALDSAEVGKVCAARMAKRPKRVELTGV